MLPSLVIATSVFTANSVLLFTLGRPRDAYSNFDRSESLISNHTVIL
jgi:hypothetical protein